ncbi:uncharacterized protein L969DRAFT_48959 [Mixia osmundae IAM 14324]|uniref:Gfo/Idh/MocA-like oxidoreductase N-terminal domain-containing protein n=1 Tax=Mixia osmundae (strain CBS 9802 / IAM 14324 / JCM 22182 / KY 12970) TaxID=764103 RepID=G7E3G2_MIXOS|nr:uncharacterized protein L969DRAFT_48959 [Mixia osmundae IAM 14324]KEI39359.1 hypothetical protein L969DRAFT_48959 [Mixia osmundae IAM 14324]GAA97372.1 hypothetical protein E5Q_04050 [Mixia osmundae IAM 14324]
MVYNVAILGTGMSCFVFHAPLLSSLPEHFKLSTILARRPESQEEVKQRLPGVKTVATLDEVCADASIDLVVISTPNELHFEQAKQCLNAGKHIVVEKPLTPTAVEADKLISLAKSKGLLIAVYQNRRLDSDLLTLLKVIREGRLGQVTDFESHFDRFRLFRKSEKVWKEQARPGGGQVYDLGSHLIDQSLYLFGKPTSITGQTYSRRQLPPLELEDAFTVTLEYGPSKATGSSSAGLPLSRELPLTVVLKGSTTSLGPNMRYIVKGDRGEFRKAGVDPQEAQLIAGKTPAKDDDLGIEDDNIAAELWSIPVSCDITKPPAPQHEKIKSEKGRYLDFYRHLHDALEHKDASRLLVQPEEAREVIHLCDLAHQSAAAQKTIAL